MSLRKPRVQRVLGSNLASAHEQLRLDKFPNRALSDCGFPAGQPALGQSVKDSAIVGQDVAVRIAE